MEGVARAPLLDRIPAGMAKHHPRPSAAGYCRCRSGVRSAAHDLADGAIDRVRHDLLEPHR